MPPKLKFADGEKVLCFHGPLIYEAKCLKSTTTKDKQVKYFIHYAGWNKNWDEWVPENRVLKYNEANVSKQKEVLKAHANQTPKAKKSKSRKTDPTAAKESDSRASTPSIESSKPLKQKLSSGSASSAQDLEAPKKKRGKMETVIDLEEQYVPKVEVNINVPDDLKELLVRDWHLINKQKKLVSLPAKLSADEILDNYVSYKKKISSSKEAAAKELILGIREYFKVMLGTQLLYKCERLQYEDLIIEHSYSDVSVLYGGVHLLRLFVKLSSVLAYTPLDDRGVEFLMSNVQDFLKYFSKNASSFCNINEYENMSAEYQRKNT